ncbi:IS200/IS605 family transposase [Aporhodopirellula aestuarii]|uniref:IS200/IS605 family transposase n=1 Tax=Aporhodopirellula aestuarii TaxID=2950107 RepID=A0ABT0TXA0_9BACT|nr:IS200/IS605 family transposase [Aporhodopirellula aestuarii]MCM2369009.1 IS200/IS605 family transposase [Aporhodopirellula aestuarii]
MSTHQQLLYHIVFSTKNRVPYLRKDDFRERVFAYMAGTCTELTGSPLRVGGHFDHAHLLVRIPAKIAVANFVGKVKANTSKHINETSGSLRKFGWQDGYGAFTVSTSQKDRVDRYIAKQMQHHTKEPYQVEYLNLLTKHEIEYDERYVWD